MSTSPSSLALFVRKMATTETKMVLANWKGSMVEAFRRSPVRKLREWEFWALANHVIDKITLPSCTVFVGCAPAELLTPLCWAAVRKRKNGEDYEVVYLYARNRVKADDALAASVQRELLANVSKALPITGEPVTFNLFKELAR